MKRRLLVLWVCLLVFLAGVAMCGAAGYKRGYIGGYGGRDGLRAGYAPGVGGGAGTDTIPADVTAPPAPAGLTAVGRDGDVLVSWTAAGQTQSVKYRVYRYFDGSPEVLLVASTVSTGAVDRTAVNGSRHNYFVLAIDNAGNISESSAVVSATPGTILSIPRPAYFAFWYQDPGVSSFSQATIDSLSAFDAIVTGPFALEGNTSEPAYNAGPGLLRRLRSASGDSTILLTYFNAQTIPADGGAYPVGSAIRRITNYCASLSDADGDSAGFGRRTNNTVATGTTYSTKFYNVSKTTLADTIAFHLVEVFDGMKVDGEYAGFFLDDADTTLSDWMITAGAQAVIDFDGNESVYEANGTELALFKAFQIDLVRAIRREFAERGMANRLLVFNGTWGRKAVPHLQDDEYTGLMDGALNEGWNRYGWPGSATMAGNAATNTGTWDLALSWGEQFPLAQTSPPLMFWNSHADSNYQYMNEVVTMAYNGFAGAQTDGDAHGTAHAPTMRRRLPLQTTLGVASYDTVAGNVSPDTLTVHTGPYDGRMVLGQAYEDTTGIWPYAITDNTKTPGQAGYYISRSAFWVIPAEVGAPAGLQFDTVPGDRTVTVYWNDPTEGDVDYFRIYRGVYNSVDSLDLFIQNPPAARVATTWQWTDATFTCNDSTYYYSVTAVDYSGNESAVDDISACTPVDGVAPTVPQNVIASGGSHYIDLDWSNSSAADLTGYYVARAPNAAGDVAGTYTARYDSVAISAYQDSTALSGDRFWYKVRAYDDDGNISDYSTAVDGSWSAPVVGAPTSLVAQANTPSQGSTYLSWSAPSDVTTLESYTLYRDRSAPYDSVYATGITSNTKIDTKATQDSTFYYSVTAVYDPGGESAHSNVVSMKNTDTVPPLTPDLQIAAGNGVNGIDLNWTDSAGAVMYYVFRGEFVATTKIDSTSASNYLDTNTIQGYTYRYRIKARDSAWNVSAQSNMLSASWVPSPSGNPTIATVSGGTVQHGEAVTLAGTGFGLKAAAAPVVWDNLEDGTVNTAATVGTWGTTTSLTPSSVSRHANSQWSAGYNFISSTSGGEELAYFQGGSPSPKWFAQYWFYLDQDFAFGPTLVSNLGNVKMFRMSNPGGSALNNVRVTTSGRYDIQIVSEYRDQSHDWHPVVPGFDWIDQIFGHANPGYVDPSYLGWKQFESDITTGTWHLFQFQFSESSMNGYDGTLKWWMDGKLIFTTSALPTRWDAQPTSFRIKELGFYNSAGGGGDYTNHFNIDDAYIDRVDADLGLRHSKHRLVRQRRRVPVRRR
jgi:fibronectin type 3 domain-containing protein